MIRVIKSVMALLMVLAMSLTTVTAFADDNYIAGTPELAVMDGGLYTVDAGKENTIRVRLRNTSAYTAYSVSAIPQYADINNTPFTIAYAKDNGGTFTVSPNGEKTLEFVVDVNETAPAKTYEVVLKMSFFNSDDMRTESTRSIYIKVTNSTGSYSYSLENYVSNPESLGAGSAGIIGATIANLSSVDMMNVQVKLDGLSTTGISVNGSDTVKFNKIAKGTRQDFKFNVLASGSLSSGNYPVKYIVTYKDEMGTEFTDEYTYYINVGGTGTSVVEIRNMAEPKGTYLVNQNFNLSFDVVNTGKGDAPDVLVSVAESEGAIVPKSLSKVSVGTLKPGESKRVSFTMAATEAAKSRNYSICITVEYGKGGGTESYKQYAGVNIENGDENSSKPKIIVSKYECDPVIVMAGEEFNLNMDFLNTNASKSVKNIKMYLTLFEETSSDSAKTGNIFTPVNSSNTFYVDSIGPKGTVSKTIRLYTVPTAQPKTYTLTVNFEYEDAAGKEYTATELLGINVKQPTKIELGEIYMPEMLEIGMYNNVSFEIYNTGNVTVSNLMIKLDGDIEATTKSNYYGSFESGNTEYYDNGFSVLNEGENKVTLTVSYDDPSGDHIEDVREYTITGTAPFVPEDPDAEQTVVDEGGSIGSKIGAAVIVAVIIAFIAVFIKKSKNTDDSDKTKA